MGRRRKRNSLLIQTSTRLISTWYRMGSTTMNGTHSVALKSVADDKTLIYGTIGLDMMKTSKQMQQLGPNTKLEAPLPPLKRFPSPLKRCELPKPSLTASNQTT